MSMGHEGKQHRLRPWLLFDLWIRRYGVGWKKAKRLGHKRMRQEAKQEIKTWRTNMSRPGNKNAQDHAAQSLNCQMREIANYLNKTSPSTLFLDGFMIGFQKALAIDPWHYPPEMPAEESGYLLAWKWSPLDEKHYAAITHLEKALWWIEQLKVSGYEFVAWQPIAPTREG